MSGPVAIVVALALTSCTTGAMPVRPREREHLELPSVAATGRCTYVPAETPATEASVPPAAPTRTGRVPATITTNRGRLHLVLDAEVTPCTVNSFISLTRQGFYDQTTCHRLTAEAAFTVQCGDPSGTGRGGPRYTFDDELTGTERYPAGTVASVTEGPNSNGSQFFMVYQDSHLDPAYTVFGRLDAAGIRVLRKLAAAGTTDGSPDGPPQRPIVITRIRLG